MLEVIANEEWSWDSHISVWFQSRAFFTMPGFLALGTTKISRMILCLERLSCALWVMMMELTVETFEEMKRPGMWVVFFSWNTGRVVFVCLFFFLTGVEVGDWT